MGESRLITGTFDEALARAKEYAEKRTGATFGESPDITLLTYQGLAIEDVRELRTLLATGPVEASVRIVIIRAERFFSEAQNAFLKMLEEPLPHTCVILSVPNEATLLDTVLSRVVREDRSNVQRREVSQMTEEFLALSKKEREAYITKLTDKLRTGSDADKRELRTKARTLVEEVTLMVRSGGVPLDESSRRVLLKELAVFAPLMHERSAPIKMILLHLSIALP